MDRMRAEPCPDDVMGEGIADVDAYLAWPDFRNQLPDLVYAPAGVLAGYLLATNLFELEYGFSPALWLGGMLSGVLFVGLSGLAATWRVVTHAPVNVLRAA